MKIGFVSCVELGRQCVQAMVHNGLTPNLIISLHDHLARNKSGRVYFDDLCSEHGIALHKTAHINDADNLEALRNAGIELLLIVGWSQIASPEILRSVKLCLGMHPTLLPEGRGRAPIPWAILKRLDRTGVSLFELGEQADTGALYAQKVVPMHAQIDATELYRSVANAHAQLLCESLPKIISGSLKATAQDESRATHWPARKPEDGQIDLSGSVYDAERLVRAVTRPYPGAFACLPDAQLRIWSARVCAQAPEGRFIEFKDGFLQLLDYDDISPA